uniref:BTB domain-containing protein n=1 Tax=Panagrellus redivivus TaxID=6233 RepID=A0A7E4VP07_PANRE
MHRFVMKTDSYKSSISLDVDKALLTATVIGQSLQTPNVSAPGNSSLTWGIRCFPAGVTTEPEKVFIEFWINQAPMNVVADFTIRGTTIKHTVERTFDVTTTVPRIALVSHTDLLASGGILKDKFVVQCAITFKKASVVTSENLKACVTAPLVAQALLDVTNHDATDVNMVVGGRSLPLHRGYLCMISPVFHAMFTHDTKEAKSGIVTVKDFQFEAVEDAMNFCYGRSLENKNATEIIEALKVVDKYDIKGAIIALEDWLLANLNDNNVCDIADYAWNYNSEKLLQKCAEHYNKTLTKIASDPKFVELDPTVVSGLIKAAANLKV